MPERSYLRPMDKSLQAYKDWIMAMAKSLNPNAKNTMTEEEWVQRWKKFWAKVEGVEDDPEATTSDP
jgi:hypothetical protein